ncbi:hypothetical protein Cgig2_003682 [Carnegiea gigantea]|uniref:Uncharacterized protein n=1 Tax=Carnegiea gigantea TaxID=171969 RepID=A0A9Q1KGX2_9CARY|nr:hypothetical protein Cgig2_003682 [Carnegiea gigantea]
MLEYRTFLMDGHLVQTLLQAWNPESKCFKLGRREVLFSHFDIALLTGFPATRKLVTFKRSDGGSEVEQVLKGAMEERVCRERQRRRTAQKDMRIYRNYVSVLLKLCRVNNTVERVALFKKLYTFLVVSGLLFPHDAGGAAWDLVYIVEDEGGVGEYNWAEAMWFYEYSSIYPFVDERRVPRLSSWVNLYKGKKYDAGVVVRKLKDSEIIPVIEVMDDERRIQAVEALITSEVYSAYMEDAQVCNDINICYCDNYVVNGILSTDLVTYLLQGVISVEERLQRVRYALRKEREALAKEIEAQPATKKELAELKEAAVMKTTVEDILEFARIQGLNSTVDTPERPVGEEGTNIDIFTPDVGVKVDRASPRLRCSRVTWLRLSQRGRVCHQDSLGHIRSRRRAITASSEEWPKSSIVKKVRTCPQPRNPSVMQSSPYLHLNRAVGKGKRKCGNVYTSQKRSKKDGGVSAAHVAGTDMDVGGAPPSKVKRGTSNMSVAIKQVGDESSLGSSKNANMEAIVQAVVNKGFPTGEVRVDDVDGYVHVRMVVEEGAAEATLGTTVSGDLTVDYVHNSIDQGRDGGRQSPCDVIVDANVVVTDEKSDEGVGKDGLEVATQSEKVSAFLVNFEARVECCVNDCGAGCNGFQLWDEYPIGGYCVDDGFQCANAISV